MEPIITKEENYLIPENGSVVIIDDQPNEALPIVKALSKKGIATTYYQGSIEEDLPETPVQCVRLLFLDLQIIDSNNETQISRSIINVLLRIIGMENGPYLLVIWSSKFNIYAESVKEEINKHNHLIPACIVNFDKAACLESKHINSIDVDLFKDRLKDLLEGQLDDQDVEVALSAVEQALNEEYRTEYEAKIDAINIIEEQLKTELEKAGSFHLFVIWENIVKTSAAKIVNDITSLIDKNIHWESNAKNVFKRMGLARTGRNILKKEEFVRESINTLNISLVDKVEQEMKKSIIPNHITIENDLSYQTNINSNTFSLREKDGNAQIEKDGKVIKSGKGNKALKNNILKCKEIGSDDKTNSIKVIDAYEILAPSLNTKLHIELSPSQELIPGNIYFNLEDNKKEQYIKSFLSTLHGNKDEYYLIDLEVSPICDYAQQKWKRSRTLPGLMYPKKYDDNIQSGNQLYKVDPSFIIDEVEYKFIFDYHLFNASDKATAKEREVKYRLKRELLLDIIAQLSSHVNRPGISFIQ